LQPKSRKLGPERFKASLLLPKGLEAFKKEVVVATKGVRRMGASLEDLRVRDARRIELTYIYRNVTYTRDNMSHAYPIRVFSSHIHLPSSTA
jgi:hypothetical protein